jgi:hypothetical protein
MRRGLPRTGVVAEVGVRCRQLCPDQHLALAHRDQVGEEHQLYKPKRARWFARARSPTSTTWPGVTHTSSPRTRSASPSPSMPTVIAASSSSRSWLASAGAAVLSLLTSIVSAPPGQVHLGAAPRRPGSPNGPLPTGQLNKQQQVQTDHRRSTPRHAALLEGSQPAASGPAERPAPAAQSPGRRSGAFRRVFLRGRLPMRRSSRLATSGRRCRVRYRSGRSAPGTGLPDSGDRCPDR